MSVTAPKDNQIRGRETTRTLREILSRQGLRESRSGADEGFYFVEGAFETAVYYNAAGQMRDAGLLTCCRALAQRGFTLTLFLSERTSGLFVRDE